METRDVVNRFGNNFSAAHHAIRIDGDPSRDGKGVFIYRSEDGTGAFSASDVSLRWNYGLDNVA